MKLLIALVEEVGFHLAQECFWYNPAKLPSPAEWVTVRRQRVKDSVEYIWWLSKTPWPKADNRNVLVPYSADMERLIKRGYKAKLRPSGHNITGKFQVDRGGAIPANMIERGNNASNSEYIAACRAAGFKLHPARFPSAHARARATRPAINTAARSRQAAATRTWIAVTRRFSHASITYANSLSSTHAGSMPNVVPA